MRLLVVEDDNALRAILVKRLKADGYAVDDCDNGTDGLEFASCAPYDAVILDIMLPGLNGLEVLSRMRAVHNECAVLLLTAKDTIADRVRGLDLGADDYLVKPFAYDELLARIRALLRKHTQVRSPLLHVAGLSMDTSARTVTRDGRSITLSAKEYAMLEYFMRNAGQVLTRDQIADHVWDNECSFESNLVDVYVRYLRGKIDKDAPQKLLHTVRGTGYVLRGEEE
ncbi:MAG: response regulator transcription factor [Eubacteriales bacterium]|nr:response regulator transcription factor [Eubacteriales bacterium]